MSSLTLDHGEMIVQTPYDPGFVAELKTAIPATERKFDPKRKAWVVAPEHGNLVASLITLHFGEMVFVPQLTNQKPPVETKILEIHYVGQTKERPGATERSAFGMDATGDWSVIFPEKVLRDWFMAGDAMPGDMQSLYGVLGISSKSSLDEVKAAFRRLARQWHPDVCKEPDAAAQMRRINEAYQILNDPNKRARYDAGLALEATLNRQLSIDANNFRSPLRCGLILAEGANMIGRFNVSKILAWEDITNQHGQTLVTSWPMGATKPVEVWA